MSTLHESAEASLSENPVIQEHIGMIKELDPNLSDFDPDGKLNYMIEGTKGFGKVIFEADTSTDPPTIKSGIIEMSSGEVYELVPK
ncbi:MAG: hypothetical protein KDN22_18450 [Verrucomicrobiae bacterium]|nr:hypothetical protein [Verrucomicrobiae bacterium]